MARDDGGSSEFALVVRDADTQFAFSTFGVVKLAMIENTFYAILSSLHAHRQQLLMETSMFSGDAMMALLDGLSDDEDLKKMPDLDANAIHSKDTAKIVLGPVQVRLVLDKYPRVGLFTTKAVVGEAIKLVKFLNTEFGFSASQCLIVPARKQLQHFELDDFCLSE